MSDLAYDFPASSPAETSESQHSLDDLSNAHSNRYGFLPNHGQEHFPPAGDDYHSADFGPPPNPSAPYLHSEHLDPSAVADRMSSLHIGDSLQQQGLAPNYADPIQRAGTSASMHSAHLHYANGLPPAPNSTLPLRPRYPQADSQHAPDDTSLYSASSSTSRHDSGYAEAADAPGADFDITSMYTYDESEYAGNDYHNPAHFPPQHAPHQYQPNWQGSHTSLNSMSTHPTYQHPGDYNASPHEALPMGAHPPIPTYPQGNPYLGQPFPENVPSPYMAQGTYQSGPSLSPYPMGGPPNPSMSQNFDDTEFEMRPALHRSGTTASVSPRTRKTKAVDLTAPPFTKEYIDQYRQRIKADPDPEAHFLYAKYLIEAAKKIGADAKDQRAVKRYRDLLIQESLKTIRRLAMEKDSYDEAQFFLANCYGTGTLGLQVDHERAYHLYLQAAKQNHPAASYRVAVCNEIGAGTRRDPARAAAFYRKAASLGDTAAMYKLGMLLLLGTLGEQKNPREAINWLRRAAEQADEENPHALHELAMLHEMPNSQLVAYDPAYAKALYTQAAHLGYTQSQYKLGQCYEYGTLTCPVDPRRSIAWYTKAAEKGYTEAELALSGWYLTGSEGVLKQSDSEAYLWARKAANQGLAKAEYAVGYYAEVGIGIKQDIEFAKRWYMRAAAQGNKRAMNRLTEMKRAGNKRSNVGRPTRQQAKDECVIC